MARRRSSLAFGLTAFLLAGLSPSLASLLPPSQEPAPSYGDALISASLGEPSTLVPILASDSASAEVCSLLFNGLVKYDVDLRVTGDLAERWEILDGGLTIEFTLKKGIRWHDGHPLTTRDVAFTYEKLMDPAVPTPYRGDFERIAGLTVIDDRTIRVRYKEPFAPALSSWGMSILPEHLLKGQDLLTTAFKENPVGTGPFKFRRWIRGDRVELSANDDYFEGRPYLDHCFFRVIPDASTIFLELQAQGVDWASLTPLQFARMSQAPAFERSFRKFRFPSFGYTYLGYNLQDPKFQDRRVRQAINLAIDKSEIIQGVLLGLGREATGPFPPESWACNPEVQPAPFDPSYARALLAEAGWSDKDGDGVLDRAGQPFEFTLLTNQGNLTRELTAQIIQRRLKEIGVRVKIRILEWSSLLKEFIDKRRFEAILLGWALSREPDPFDIWHSSKTKPGEFNFIGYRDPRVDELLIKGRTTYDEASRRKAYHELHRILYEDQPVCFLFVPDALPAVHRRFEGVEVSPLGVGHNLIHWYAPRARQRFRLEP